MKPKIKEVIVVEGKDDVSALRKAVEADILITTGLGLTVAKIEEIKKLAERRGVIVFTDPDFPGGKIRRILKEHVPNCMRPIINAKIKLLSELTEHTIANEIKPPQEILRKEFQ